jgi:hypothetical protein
VVKTAVIIPVVAVILLVLVGFIVVLVLVIKRRGNKSDDWEIEYSELEVGEQLGAGGYPHHTPHTLSSLLARCLDSIPFFLPLPSPPRRQWCLGV